MHIPNEVRDWFDHDQAGRGAPPGAVLSWLEDIVRTNYRLLFTIAFGKLDNSAEAEDVVQHSVISAWDKLATLNEPEAIVAWIATIVRNRSIDCLRARRPTEAIDATNNRPELMVEPVQDRVGAELDAKAAIRQAVASLPDGQALVVILRYLEDLDPAEIAERLGIDRNTVHQRHFRAMKRLANHPRLLALVEPN